MSEDIESYSKNDEKSGACHQAHSLSAADDVKVLPEHQELQEIDKKISLAYKASLWWGIVVVLGTIPVHLQRIRESTSLKNYFFGDAKSVREYFSFTFMKD